MERFVCFVLCAVSLLGVAHAAPSCVAGNYTEDTVGGAIYNITLMNGTHLTAHVLFYPKTGKVNWTLGNGTMMDENHFMMTFPYQNGWVDHENGTLSEHCMNITWSPNKAVWKRATHLSEVNTIHVVDTSRLDCRRDIGEQLADANKLLCANLTTAHPELIPLLSKHYQPVLHIRYPNHACQPDNIPHSFRWQHKQSGHEITVMTSPSLREPMHFEAISHEAYIVADGSTEANSHTSLADAAKALYPSANVVDMPMVKYAELLQSQADSLPTMSLDHFPSLC